MTRHDRRALAAPRPGYLWFALILAFPWASACAAESSASPSTADAFRVLLRAQAPTSPTLVVARPEFLGETRAAERRRMVDQQIAAHGVRDPEVLAAMRRVPRHLFVPSDGQSRAYGDHPLPIGHGQTISQPYIVGYMTEILRLKPEDRVLEIGTGSAYQAAILAEIVDHVVTIEIVEPLAQSAARGLEQIGYRNVTVVEGDGYFGWREDGPYDAIMVTAAAEHIPPPLIEQLKPGGRMVIPVGRTGWTQNLLLVHKMPDGKIRTENLLPVRFVPLTRRTY